MEMHNPSAVEMLLVNFNVSDTYPLNPLGAIEQHFKSDVCDWISHTYQTSKAFDAISSQRKYLQILQCVQICDFLDGVGWKRQLSANIARSVGIATHTQTHLALLRLSTPTFQSI